MEITFLASLHGACMRPEVYFKCNWVWCVHKGKMVCSWLKWSTLYCFWIHCQTFSTARVYLHPFFCFFFVCVIPELLCLALMLLGPEVQRQYSSTCSTATFGNTPNSISFTARLMTMTTPQSKRNVKLVFFTSPYRLLKTCLFLHSPVLTVQVGGFSHPLFCICKHFLSASGAAGWILEAVGGAERMLDNGWDWWVFGRFPCDPTASGRNKVMQVWQPASIY